MGDEQVGPEPPGLVDDGQGRVDRGVDPADGVGGIPGDESDAVPRLGGLGWVVPVEDGDDVTEGEAHVGPAGVEPTTPAV